jgi:cobyrinic acid a,c-diamide synthase
MTVEENVLTAQYLDHLVGVIRSSVDLGMLWAIAGAGDRLELPQAKEATPSVVRIAVARDKAFCFVYESNLQLFRNSGAELIEFSPLADASLPEGISGIYLPGGYPEAYADELSANSSMKKEIKGAIEAGMPVYAECGGFIYLTAGIAVKGDGRESLKEFVGIFPVTTTMLNKRKALGYREIKLLADSILGRKGAVARGHEFHYSETEEMSGDIERLYQVSKRENDLGTEGYRYKNCLASYIHLHFGSNPGMAEAFVDSCRKFGKSRPKY